MRYFSMFSGIGGFELGIADRGECIGYSEINKYAIKVYERHFDHENYGDAATIDTTNLPDFDLLVGGFPCQSFSVAGKRLGFDDTRGTLFFDIARILSNKRPRHLVLENVKGLLSHDSGKTFQTILGVLTDLGYFLEWQVLNSKNFGVPQNRERVFIVGHLGVKCSRQVLPIQSNDQVRTRPQEDSQAVHTGTQTARQYASWNGDYLIEQRPQHGKPLQVYKKLAPTVQARYGTGGKNVPAVVRQPLRYLNRNQKNIEGDYAYTVDASRTSGIRIGERVRQLTPKECERLQGFPDDWTDGESDTQRYKMCGNAVTVNVVQAVMERLCV